MYADLDDLDDDDDDDLSLCDRRKWYDVPIVRSAGGGASEPDRGENGEIGYSWLGCCGYHLYHLDFRW